MQQTRDSSHSIARLDQRRRAIEAEIKALELEVTKRLKEKQQLQDDRQDDVAERERLQVSLRGIERPWHRTRPPRTTTVARLPRSKRRLPSRTRS